MITGMPLWMQISMTSQLMLKERLPMRSFSLSCASRPGRPIGRARDLKGDLNAWVQVVQGVPSQTAPATLEPSHPLRVSLKAARKWSSTAPCLRSRSRPASARRFTASVRRPEPAKSSSTTRRIRRPCSAAFSRRLRCRMQLLSSAASSPASRAAQPARLWQAASGPACPPRLGAGPKSAAPVAALAPAVLSS